MWTGRPNLGVQSGLYLCIIGMYLIHIHRQAGPSDVHLPEMHAYEMYAYEMHVYEVHTHEMHACKVHIYEVHAMRYTPRSTRL